MARSVEPVFNMVAKIEATWPTATARPAGSTAANSGEGWPKIWTRLLPARVPSARKSSPTKIRSLAGSTAVLVLAILSVNFLGDGLRDALDPTQRVRA